MKQDFRSFALHRYLVSAGIDNIVVHAAGIEVAVNNPCEDR